MSRALAKLKAQDWFYVLLGAALVTHVAEDIFADGWGVQAGRLYPWRHFSALPLLPPWTLALEWIARSGAGIALIVSQGARARRGDDRVRLIATLVAIAALIFSLSQRFENQKTLLTIVLAYAAIGSATLIRYQLLLVYLFSAVNKLVSGFQDGRTLSATLAWAAGLPEAALFPRSLQLFASDLRIAQGLSLATLGIELALPILMLRSPRAGFALLALLHGGFSSFLPGTWAFSLTMLAMGTLFWRQRIQMPYWSV